MALTPKELTKDIAKRKGVDPRVVKLASDSLIKFMRDKISDPEDMRPIRVRYFAVATPKTNYEKTGEEREIPS